jgi:hypothetical protein
MPMSSNSHLTSDAPCKHPSLDLFTALQRILNPTGHESELENKCVEELFQGQWKGADGLNPAAT